MPNEEIALPETEKVEAFVELQNTINESLESEPANRVTTVLEHLTERTNELSRDVYARSEDLNVEYGLQSEGELALAILISGRLELLSSEEQASFREANNKLGAELTEIREARETIEEPKGKLANLVSAQSRAVMGTRELAKAKRALEQNQPDAQERVDEAANKIVEFDDIITKLEEDFTDSFAEMDLTPLSAEDIRGATELLSTEQEQA